MLYSFFVWKLFPDLSAERLSDLGNRKRKPNKEFLLKKRILSGSFRTSRRLLNEEAHSLDKADTERYTASRNVKSGFSDPPSSTELIERKRDFELNLQLELLSWFH